MNDLYVDKTYINLVAKELEAICDDLEKISVYNGDFLNEEVGLMRTHTIDIQAKIKERIK